MEYPSGEYELIEAIRRHLPENSGTAYEEAIGDDAAVRVNRIAGEKLIITADISVENVHFSVDTMSLEEVGYRAMVSNLSDCASMGAAPDSAVVQLVFPRGEPGLHKKVEEIYRGFGRACRKWNFPLVGGDLSCGPVWTLGITLIGRIDAGARVLKRKGIRAGDVLWVTGMPGESAAGFAALKHWGRDGVPERFARLVNAHVSPVPRIEQGLALARSVEVHSMMDLSDGLSKDVATLCFENDLGFLFDDLNGSAGSELLNLSGELKMNWADWFFHGGEEYELLFAAQGGFDPCQLPEFSELIPVRLGCFTEEFRGVRVQFTDGTVGELPGRSWDHVKESCKRP